jgi:gamma-glutamylcyclotransferase (GGCT)/AIG2-like uncharacterized protein YtfP
MPQFCDETQYPLFVFGTLRLGQENHHYLAGKYDRVISGAVLGGYARVAELMIAQRAASHVVGELFFLTPSLYESTLASCDELEELPPGQLVGHEYQRKLVEVVTASGGFTAWAYVQPESNSG